MRHRNSLCWGSLTYTMHVLLSGKKCLFVATDWCFFVSIWGRLPIKCMLGHMVNVFLTEGSMRLNFTCGLARISGTQTENASTVSPTLLELWSGRKNYVSNEQTARERVDSLQITHHKVCSLLLHDQLILFSQNQRSKSPCYPGGCFL
jgi:hypothetical protein